MNKTIIKTMSLLTLFTLGLFSTGYAKMITKEIKVHGDCHGCKVKIEDALDIKGVTFAEWNVESKVLKLRFNDKTISYTEIREIIAELGYKIEDSEENEKKNRIIL